MNIESYGFLGLFIALVSLIISILMILAVLKIPLIARYNLAQLKLLALLAKKYGVPQLEIEHILKENDSGFKDDKTFQQQLTDTTVANMEQG